MQRRRGGLQDLTVQVLPMEDQVLSLGGAGGLPVLATVASVSRQVAVLHWVQKT